MTFKYPLLENAFSTQDIKSAIKVIKSRRITMSVKTKEFEKKFSKFIKSKYCLMVNSGSSANLMAFFTLINPLKTKKLKRGDECLVPALCWSTSLWPIYQAGLKPKFVDVDLKTFSPNLETIKKNISKKTKAIMLINILGNCSEIDKIRNFTKKKKIYLIEDNCESLGSIYKKKYLGTFGDFSSFSFYYSHQLTAGEGGMIVCKNKSDYKIMQTLRAHGWDREITGKKNTFNFINQGFNLRPLDVSAAIAASQLNRIKVMIKTRLNNRNKIIKSLKNSKKWNNQFTFFEPIKRLEPSWFSIPLMINKKFILRKKNYLNFLSRNNIETRAIISGNFLNQPSVKLHNIKFNKKNFKNAQEIEDRGFFIGLPSKPISKNHLRKLTNILLNLN